MKIDNIDNFINGWFIGNFEPSILKTQDFEVCLKLIPKGQTEASARQKTSTEISILVEGRAIVKGKELNAGEIWLIEPMEVADFEALENCKIVGVKTPSLPSDKEAV